MTTTVFISYAWKDAKQLALKLYEELERRGINTWLDEKRLLAGERMDNRIQQEIAKRDRFVVIISPQAAASDFVRQEIEWALTAGKDPLPIITDWSTFSEHFRELKDGWNGLREFENWINDEHFLAGIRKVAEALGLETYHSHREIVAHAAVINATAFSSDGKMLATASDDEIISLWRLPSGASIDQIGELEGDGYYRGKGVTFSSEGDYFALSWYYGEITVCDVKANFPATKNLQQRQSLANDGLKFRPHSNELFSLEQRRDYSDDRSRLVSWLVPEGIKHRTMAYSDVGLTAYCFSPEGDVAVIGTDGGHLIQWKLEVDKKKIWRVEGLKGLVIDLLEYSPDGSWLAVAAHEESDPGVIDVSMEELFIEPGAEKKIENSKSEFESNQRIIGIIKLADFSLHTFEDRIGFESFAFSPNKDRPLFALSCRNSIEMWHTELWEQDKWDSFHVNEVGGSNLGFSPPFGAVLISTNGGKINIME